MRKNLTIFQKINMIRFVQGRYNKGIFYIAYEAHWEKLL